MSPVGASLSRYGSEGRRPVGYIHYGSERGLISVELKMDQTFVAKAPSCSSPEQDNESFYSLLLDDVIGLFSLPSSVYSATAAGRTALNWTLVSFISAVYRLKRGVKGSFRLISTQCFSHQSSLCVVGFSQNNRAELCGIR